MKHLLVTLLCAAATVPCPYLANAYTLSFDDLGDGERLAYSAYSTVYGAQFSDGFYAAYVNAPSTYWAYPHSGDNAMRWRGQASDVARTDFGFSERPYQPPYVPYAVASVGAYFCTATDAAVRLAAYRNDGSLVDSVVIGGPGQQWRNQWAQIAPGSGPIDYFVFEGVNSPDDLRNFCADDMTIVPVPEPSTLSFLSLALAGVGAGRLRRRK